MSIDAEKNLIRQAMLDRRRRLPSKLQAEAGKAAALQLKVFNKFAESSNVGLYWPVGGEIPTGDCFRLLREGGRLVAFPRFVPGEDRLEFASTERESQLRKGFFGVKEPDPTLPAMNLRELDLMIVPGVAFDIRGARLGWGKGYYDQVLRGFLGKKVGLAYDFQIVDWIPTNSQDELVDYIVTESRVVSCCG